MADHLHRNVQTSVRNESPPWNDSGRSPVPRRSSLAILAGFGKALAEVALTEAEVCTRGNNGRKIGIGKRHGRGIYRRFRERDAK
jgi:hypothetical protein